MNEEGYEKSAVEVRGDVSTEDEGGEYSILSWCPAFVAREGGFGFEDTGGGDLARNNEDEDGDDRRGPGWWKSCPSACWAESISMVAMLSYDVPVLRSRRMSGARLLLNITTTSALL